MHVRVTFLFMYLLIYSHHTEIPFPRKIYLVNTIHYCLENVTNPAWFYCISLGLYFDSKSLYRSHYERIYRIAL